MFYVDRGDGKVSAPFLLHGQEGNAEDQKWLETTSEPIAPWFQELENMSGVLKTAPNELLESSLQVIVPETKSKKRRWKKAAKKAANKGVVRCQEQKIQDHFCTLENKSQSPDRLTPDSPRALGTSCDPSPVVEQPLSSTFPPYSYPLEPPSQKMIPRKEESAELNKTRKQGTGDKSLDDLSEHKCRRRKKRSRDRQIQVTPLSPPRKQEYFLTSLPARSSYRASKLRAHDSLAYRAAGVIFSRTGPRGGLQFLLGKKRQKEAWTVLGGKREGTDGGNSLETAFRELHEETAGLLGADTYRYLKEWASSQLVTFIADGKYVLYTIDCNDQDFEASHMEKLGALPLDYLKKPAKELTQVAWLPCEWVRSRYCEMSGFLKVVFSTEVFLSQFQLAKTIGGTSNMQT